MTRSANRGDMGLIDDFTHTGAPGFAIGGARDLDQAAARAVRTARRVGVHFYRIADLERVLVDSLLRELCGAGTLEHPPLYLSAGVVDLDVQERVRRAQRDLDDLALDRDLFRHV